MVLGQEVHYYMVYIAYFTELNLQICEYAQKRRICRKNSKYALPNNFYGHFCPRRKAANFCQPGVRKVFQVCSYMHIEKNLEHVGLRLLSSFKNSFNVFLYLLQPPRGWKGMCLFGL